MASSVIGSLRVNLGIDTAAFSDGLKTASSKLAGSGGEPTRQGRRAVCDDHAGRDGAGLRDGRPGRAVRAASDFLEYSGAAPMTVEERRSLWRAARGNAA
jgi:hypothetical protein